MTDTDSFSPGRWQKYFGKWKFHICVIFYIYLDKLWLFLYPYPPHTGQYQMFL